MFTREVIDELKFYVYRLIDPRNGETFYVGKGRGNRVFDHAADQLDANESDLPDKLKKIREILVSGFEVQHVIHRHGMDSATAFEVESALIEAYPSVTNIAGGHGNSEFGVMHSKQIVEKYMAKEAVIDEPAIEIIVNKRAAEVSVYDAARFAWKVSFERASKAKYALAVVNGLIIDVFEIEKWLQATSENFPSFEISETDDGRYGFIGKPALEAVRSKYIRTRIPARPKGAANPIRYHNI